MSAPKGFKSFCDRQLALGSIVVVLCAAMMSTISIAAENGFSAEEASQRFAEARQAFDQQDFSGAAAKYEALLKDGWTTPEVFFNLGNAYFKAGNLGAAILNYRRAWYLRPRDPDIRANLQFASQTAGAVTTVYSPPENLAFQLSQKEWLTAGVAAWWAMWLLGGAAVWQVRFRPLLWRLAAIALVITVVSASATLLWHRLKIYPECVVKGGRIEARFAPLETGIVHFVLPEGSIVRAIEKSGSWIKILSQKKEGWLLASSVEAVNDPSAGIDLLL